MNKATILLFSIILITGCSLHKNSKFWSPTKNIIEENNESFEEIFVKEEEDKNDENGKDLSLMFKASKKKKKRPNRRSKRSGEANVYQYDKYYHLRELMCRFGEDCYDFQRNLCPKLHPGSNNKLYRDVL